MPKKVIQYKVDGKTYNHRWIAEIISALKSDGYLYDQNVKISHFPNGFRISYSQEITTVITESDTIEAIRDKCAATSDEILNLINKGWTFTYDGKSFYEIPVNDNLVDTIKEAMDYLIDGLIIQPETQSVEIEEQIKYKARDELFSSKKLAQIFEDIVADKKLEATSVHPIFEEIHTSWPTKRIKLAIGEYQIRIKTELHQKVTSKHILKYDELGYEWSTDGRYSIWQTKTNSVDRQLFAKVLRDIDLLLEKD